MHTGDFSCLDLDRDVILATTQTVEAITAAVSNFLAPNHKTREAVEDNVEAHRLPCLAAPIFYFHITIKRMSAGARLGVCAERAKTDYHQQSEARQKRYVLTSKVKVSLHVHSRLHNSLSLSGV